MYVLKSRGTAHSNQLREFVLTPKGVKLIAPYLGPEGVLTGSSRVAQEAKESAVAVQRREEAGRKRRAIERRMKTLDTEIAALRLEMSAESDELERLRNEESRSRQQLTPIEPPWPPAEKAPPSIPIVVLRGARSPNRRAPHHDRQGDQNNIQKKKSR